MDEAVAYLESFAAAKSAAAEVGVPAPAPFFLALGLHKPHLPLLVPEPFFEPYRGVEAALAANPYAPAYMPKVAYASYELQVGVRVRVTFPTKVACASYELQVGGALPRLALPGAVGVESPSRKMAPLPVL